MLRLKDRLKVMIIVIRGCAMSKWIILLVSLLSLSSFANDLPDIAPAKLLATDTQDWLILDVRSPEEYAEGHVPGAINIAHTALASRLDEINEFSDKPVVVYCRSGFRAGKAGDVLLQANFKDVRHLDGDFTAWKEAGYEMKK